MNKKDEKMKRKQRAPHRTLLLHLHLRTVYELSNNDRKDLTS